MKPARLLSEESLMQQAIELLIQKLGPIETTRFLSLSAQNRMESVKRHQHWQASLDKTEFFRDVFGESVP
ncbi:hypothetical protein WDW89_10520 [Deltaproteobacteria bacterium TL4]